MTPLGVVATLVNGSGVTSGASSTTSSTSASGPYVKITWNPNPEPDVIGYAVYRVHGGTTDTNAFAGCSTGYQTTTPPPCPAFKPSVTDDSSGGGTFSYRVQALRWGTTWDVSQAVPSLPSKASNQVSVPGAPTTTTTTPSSNGAGAFAVFGPITRTSSSGGSSSFGSPRFSGSSTATTSDSGFASDLPFGSEAGQPGDQAQAPDGPTIKAPLSSHARKSVGALALGATGLLLLVVAMGGLWLRTQVKRAGVLEPLDPDI